MHKGEIGCVLLWWVSAAEVECGCCLGAEGEVAAWCGCVCGCEVEKEGNLVGLAEKQKRG